MSVIVCPKCKSIQPILKVVCPKCGHILLDENVPEYIRENNIR